jgi:hypothetical protein
MYWLDINREPVSPAELLNDIVAPVFQGEFLEGLESLLWRSFIEKAAIQFQEKSVAGFTQQPLIRECITEKIIEQLYPEITQGKRILFLEYLHDKGFSHYFCLVAQN